MNNTNKIQSPQDNICIMNKKNNKIMGNITQEDFDAYEDVRQSGVTNMFAVSTVSDYSGLSKDKIISIMKNYSALSDKYGN
jgi:hypothetical protein